MGRWIWKDEGRVYDLQLPCLAGKCALEVPRECLWELGAGAERGAKEIPVSHWRWAERKKKLQQLGCCTSGAVAGGLDFGEWRRGW